MKLLFLAIVDFLVRIVTRSRPTSAALPDGVHIRRAKWLPALGGFLTRRDHPMAAVTIGRIIVTHPNREITGRLVRHELVHVAQWQRYWWTFPFRYALNHVRYGYKGNPFEIEAETAEKRIFDNDY